MRFCFEKRNLFVSFRDFIHGRFKMELNNILDTLPDEIIMDIFSHLSIPELFVMSCVNQRCCNISMSDSRLKFANISQIMIKNIDKINNFTIVRRRRQNYVVIEGLDLILRFIGFFSLKIKDVSINYAGCSEKSSKMVFEAIGYFLKDIEKLSISYSVFNAYPIDLYIFKNVKILQFVSSYLPWWLCNISFIFPVVADIRFFGYNCFERIDNVLTTYRHLKIFRVNSMCLQKTDFNILAILNPEAKIIPIQIGVDIL